MQCYTPSMIDTHSHLDDASFDADRNEVIQRAFDSGLEAIIVIGCDLGSSRAAVELADKNRRIFAAVGVHPHEAKHSNDDIWDNLIKLAGHPKVRYPVY